MSDAHLTYDELETPHQMHSDCEAVESNLSLKRLIPPVIVPAQAAYVGEAARRIAAKPIMVVSEAAAKVASKLNPFD
jgi:hypothetical protein